MEEKIASVSGVWDFLTREIQTAWIKDAWSWLIFSTKWWYSFQKVISRYSLLGLPVLWCKTSGQKLGPETFPRASEPQHAQLDKTGAERSVSLFPLCLLRQKNNFYPAWKTVSSVTGQDSEPLFSNPRLRHNHHMGLDKFFMPELINFSGQFSSLACILPPWGTSSVTDKWDGDLWKCQWGGSSQTHQTACAHVRSGIFESPGMCVGLSRGECQVCGQLLLLVVWCFNPSW